MKSDASNKNLYHELLHFRILSVSSTEKEEFLENGMTKVSTILQKV